MKTPDPSSIPAPSAGPDAQAVAVILLAHGSRDPAWRAPFEALAASLTEQLGPRAARVAYLQFVPPTLAQAVASAVAEGFSRIRVLPLFLSSGGHVLRDIPAQASSAARAAGGAMVEVLPPVGEDPRFADLVRRIVTETFG